MTEARDFWNWRRAAVAAETQAELAARQDATEADARARMDQMSDSEVLKVMNLPEPESLEPGDDFSVFMTRAVPDRLRRRALRALWRTNPVLANVDGLVDYGEDFTDRATVVENLQTAYQVGKGMLAHLEKLSAPAPDSIAEAPPDMVLDAPPEPAAMADDAPAVADREVDQEDDLASAPTPRRMVFVYEGGAG